MTSPKKKIRFETVLVQDRGSGLKKDAVAVFRGDEQVALVLEAARLQRALSLPLDKVRGIEQNLTAAMLKAAGREPTRDEREFWRAIVDFRSTESSG